MDHHAHPAFTLALQIQTLLLYAPGRLHSPGSLFPWLLDPLGEGSMLCMEYGLWSSRLAFWGAESLPQSDHGTSSPGTVFWSRIKELLNSPLYLAEYAQPAGNLAHYTPLTGRERRKRIIIRSILVSSFCVAVPG